MSEKTEVNSLIEKGIEFKVGKRAFTIHEPCLGTLDHLSAIFLEMGFDEEKMQGDPMNEVKLLAGRTCKSLAKVVAVAVLNNQWKIRLFTPFLAKYFLWRVKPSTMLQLALIITTMSNYQDFMTAIRLMSAIRTAKPNLIAKEQA